jgi:colanic acid biosynthesis glycosyl transferase WcaI
VRICIVNEFFWPDNTGGTGTVLSDLARTLRAKFKDVEIDVLTSRNLYRTPPSVAAPADASKRMSADAAAAVTESLAPKEIWEGIQITRIATPRPNGLPTPLRLLANLMFSYTAMFKLLAAPRYDLLLIATAPPMVAVAASLYRALTGVPFIYTVYDLEPDRAIVLNIVAASHPAARILRSKQRKWFRQARMIVVLGRCMRDYLQAHYDVPSEKVTVIPVGADHEEIQPLSKRTKFRAANALTGFVVMYSGNFGRYHDFDTILNAAKRLSKLRDDIHFVLVGGGWQRQRVADRIAFEKIDNVLIKPFVPMDEYADLLASADVSLVTLEPGMDGLCVPSKFYSILASGRPTIAVVPPNTEVGLTIAEANCGLRIDHGNVEELVNAVLTLVDDAALTEQMGINARNVLMEKYTTEATAHAFYEAFVDATGGRARTSQFERTALCAVEGLEEAEV